MSPNNERNNPEEKENISIKGVQRNLYNKVKNLARETGKTVGELTNDAFKTVLSAASETKKVGEEFFKEVRKNIVTNVRDFSSLEITGRELVGNNKKVSFRNIENLVFKDVDEKVFDEFVESIVNVKTLEVPKQISKFKVLERSKFVDNLKFK